MFIDFPYAIFAFVRQQAHYENGCISHEYTQDIQR